MARTPNPFERFFYPEIRIILPVLLQLGENPPECPEYLTDIARGMFPEFAEKTNIAKELSYVNFKHRILKVPGQLKPFYGTYPQVEEELWEHPEDLELIRLIREKYQHHQLSSKIKDYVCRRPTKGKIKKTCDH